MIQKKLQYVFDFFFIGTSKNSKGVVPILKKHSFLLLPAIFSLGSIHYSTFFKDAISNTLKTFHFYTFKPFRIGDKLSVNNNVGRVKDITYYYLILNDKDKSIYVPISTLYTSTIIKYH